MDDRALVGRFWTDLYRRDWDAVAAYFGPDSEYTDVPTPADDVARGPEEIVARLRLGFDRILGIDHEVRTVVAGGGTVVTEHDEHWRWDDEHEAVLPFCSVQEVRDGRIVRWWDYWDLQTLLGVAPAWWLDHIMGGYR